MKAPEYEGPVVYAGGNKGTHGNDVMYKGSPCVH